MKRLTILLICSCITLCFAACTDNTVVPTTSLHTTAPSYETSTPTTVENSTAEYEGPLASVSMPVITEVKYSESNIPISYYSYQNISVILPDADVAESITLDMLNRIDATVAAADNIHTAAQAAYTGQADWNPYFYTITHKVTRLDQNVLSFYGNETSFDGSPRSATASISANYDLTTGTPLSLGAIFYEDYSADAICDLIIEGLSSYSEGELFSDYTDIIHQMFSTNTPVESWYFSDTGLCFYFAPYEISAFASGTIISEIPYDKLSGLLNDVYFPVEELVYSGTVKFEPITSENISTLDDFSQFGEVVLEEGSEKLLICVDGSVSDLRISLKQDDHHNAETMVFSSSGLGSTDAILVEAPAETFSNLVISYRSNGELVSITP